MTAPVVNNGILSASQFFEHWQGHRNLTRKVIEVFPEEMLFTYSLGGMRPFGVLAMEIMDLADGGIEGAATGQWKSAEAWEHNQEGFSLTKTELLSRWDKITVRIQMLAPHITLARFQETDVAFGMYEGTIYSTLLYFIDNEIHHRAQGYVYLRAMSINPPPFWDRNA